MTERASVGTSVRSGRASGRDERRSGLRESCFKQTRFHEPRPFFLMTSVLSVSSSRRFSFSFLFLAPLVLRRFPRAP